MDMSSKATTSSDMEGWKPYLHTSLFSPFSNVRDSGEAFLFPTFRIYSRATFLAACAFTFAIALVERLLTHVLDSLSLESSRQSARCTAAGTGSGGGRSVYVNIPIGRTETRAKHAKRGKIVARNLVYFAATLLRYVLMIIGMGMDWVLLLSVVSGLTVGHLVADLRVVAQQRKAEGRTREAKEVEERVLLEEQAFEDDEDEVDVDKAVRGKEGVVARSTTHRRSGSRMSQVAMSP